MSEAMMFLVVSHNGAKPNRPAYRPITSLICLRDSPRGTRTPEA